ncbi:41424_t:CDS:2 [Gigaspora margarita]|uniref:41424_t:CDS:1 n=1 Tax=Gigaspora margarita TaxID=4874 RepID=A0ABN7VR94_GIGMA|nr:41424_t:CDS:2 [Gigaspora margarita]
MHRGVQWPNIIHYYEEYQRFILIDFDYADFSPSDEPLEEFSESDHAPEMLNKKYNFKVDIWGVGNLIGSCNVIGIPSKLSSFSTDLCKIALDRVKDMFKEWFANDNWLEKIETENENADFLAKETGFLARIMELEQSAKENENNTKLRDAEINELRFRVSKLEQQNNTIDRLGARVNSSENIVNRPDFVINQCIDTNSKLLIDNTKEINHSSDNITPCEKQNTIYTDITNSGDTSKRIENSSNNISDFDICQEKDSQSSAYPILPETNSSDTYKQTSSLEQSTDLQKMQTPKIDIHPLIQELKIEPSEVNVKTVNIDKNSTSNQSFAIKLVHLFEKICFAEFNTIQAKQEEIAMSRITEKCGTNLPLREKISRSHMTNSEPSRGNNQDSEISEIQVSIPTESSYTSNSENMISEDNKSLLETKAYLFFAGYCIVKQ